MSGELGGWFIRRISRPVCATASAKSGSSSLTCERALSCYIHMVSPASSLGQQRAMAERTFDIKKALLASLLTLIVLMIKVPLGLLGLFLLGGS
jgi:hypothetical protein